jgi:hypothetical protein
MNKVMSEIQTENIKHLQEVLNEMGVNAAVSQREVNEGEWETTINSVPFSIFTVRSFYPKSMLFIPEWQENVMVIAEYITPEAKKQLKEKQINYLDSAGNIYLKLPPLFLDIDTHKVTPPTSGAKYQQRAFTKSGAAVVFQFLIDHNLVNATQRTIAEYANVSLGTIPKVFNQLEAEGYIIKLNAKERKLKDVKQLLDKWVDVFNARLLPALQSYTCKYGNGNEIDFFQNAKLFNEAQWGGEAGAAKITSYLIPENISIFTELPKRKLPFKLNLFPDSNGQIKVYEKFWKHTTANGNTVHPIIIYAMLIGTRDSRNLETAELIYKQYIEPKL